jgi:hypothetical protein
MNIKMKQQLPTMILLAIALAWSPDKMAGAQDTKPEEVQRAKDEVMYKSLLALQPNALYPTRAVASDPSTWKPVKYQAVTPTSGVTLDDTGVFKPVMENNIAYLLKT